MTCYLDQNGDHTLLCDHLHCEACGRILRFCVARPCIARKVGA